MNDESKTIFRYDSGAYGFRKVAIFLVGLSLLLAVFGIIWVISW